jgi:hypothetical protein
VIYRSLNEPSKQGALRITLRREAPMVMPPEKAQQQIITSPDGKCQMISHRRAYKDAFGCYCLEGVIKNISNEPELNVKIKVDYYDSDDTLFDSEVDTLTIPKPGGTRAFYIPYSGLRRGDIQYHIISLL